MEPCTIKFNRRSSLCVAGCDFTTYIDGKKMDVMYSDSREKTHEVEPGSHSFRVSGKGLIGMPVSSESIALNLCSGETVILEAGFLKRYLICFAISVFALAYIYGDFIVPIMDNAFTQSVFLLILLSLQMILYIKPGAWIYLKVRR